MTPDEGLGRQRRMADANAHADQAAGAGDLGLDRAALLDVYRVMVRSRRLDDKEIQLKNQSRAFFQISGAGHEAVLVAAGPDAQARLRLVPSLLSRSRAVPAARRHAARDAARVGRRRCRSEQRRPPDAVALGPPRAEHRARIERHRDAGAARGRRRRSGRDLRARRRDSRSRFDDSRATRSSTCRSGEGATSEGEFWESLNTACSKRLPVLFLIEDNGYAISVPVEVADAGRRHLASADVVPRASTSQSVDGTDFFASLRVMREAVAYVRARKGPAVVHAHVIRPYSHSLSDDEKLYKTPQEREAEARRDPITRFAEFLRHNGLATAAELEAIHREVQREVDEAAIEALKAPWPAKDTAGQFVFSPDVDPTVRCVPDGTGARGQARHDGRRHQSDAERRDGARPAHRRLRRGRRRREPPRRAGGRARQGRRLQGDARPAARLRRRPRVQRADRRSQHHRTGRRHGRSAASSRSSRSSSSTTSGRR